MSPRKRIRLEDELLPEAEPPEPEPPPILAELDADGEATPDAPPLDEAPGSRAGYTVSSWAGLPNFICRICGFAHLDEHRVARHVTSHTTRRT